VEGLTVDLNNISNPLARPRAGLSIFRKAFSMKRHRPCQICRHDRRWQIELLKAGGASLDALATKFDVSRDAVHRHWRDHVSDEMKASYLAGPTQLQELAEKAAETGTSVLDNLHAIRVILMGHLTTATEAGDGNMAANIASRLTHTLETIAKISGELGALATNTINITNNNVVLTQHPAFLKLQVSLMHALAPFSDARAAVVSALRGLDTDGAPADPAPTRKVIEHVEH
jgi:hypothetical protein